MRVVIIEDEKFAADRLEQLLRETAPEINVVARMGSVRESVKWLVHNQAELIFLDIQLSDGISFSIFEQVAVRTPVIFTTAYDQYAIKAFQLNSIAYLLKPIRKKELEESLRKFHELRSAFSIDFDALMAGIKGTAPRYKERFLVQVGAKIKKIETINVAYFYAMEKMVFMKTFDGDSWPVEFSLDKLELMVDQQKFYRINRKYLVNMDAIKEMIAWSRSRVKLILLPKTDDEMDAIVSVERSAGFKRWMGE